MLIRREQSAYLGRLAFIRRVRTLLREQFPAAKETPSRELNTQIYGQLQRAEAYGMRSEHGAAMYVVTAWLLGPQFDEKFPAVRERLSDVHTPETQKTLWLQTFSLNLLAAMEEAGQGGAANGAG